MVKAHLWGTKRQYDNMGGMLGKRTPRLMGCEQGVGMHERTARKSGRGICWWNSPKCWWVTDQWLTDVIV